MEAKERLSRLLFMISCMGRAGGVEISRLSSLLGIPAGRVLDELRLISLCGSPPFAPDDLFMVRVSAGNAFLEIDQKMGRPLQLTSQEAAAVMVCLKLLIDAGARPLTTSARSAFDKIKAALSKETAEKVRHQGERVRLEADGKEIEDTLEKLKNAVSQKEEVEITYYTASRDSLSTRSVQPCLLVNRSGYWYLVAKCMKSLQVRIFRVERIGDVRLTGEKFDVPADFDEKKYTEGELFEWTQEEMTAKVQFFPPVSRILSDLRGKGSGVAADGSVVLEMSAAHLEGLLPRLLSYREYFEVLDPPRLREMVKWRANEILSLYE